MTSPGVGRFAAIEEGSLLFGGAGRAAAEPGPGVVRLTRTGPREGVAEGAKDRADLQALSRVVG